MRMDSSRQESERKKQKVEDRGRADGGAGV